MFFWQYVISKSQINNMKDFGKTTLEPYPLLGRQRGLPEFAFAAALLIASPLA